MKMRWSFALLVVVLVLGESAGLAHAQGVLGCGNPPIIKPNPPIGCRDLVPQCVCNSRGRCWWEWICVQ